MFGLSDKRRKNKKESLKRREERDGRRAWGSPIEVGFGGDSSRDGSWVSWEAA